MARNIFYCEPLFHSNLEKVKMFFGIKKFKKNVIKDFSSNNKFHYTCLDSFKRIRFGTIQMKSLEDAKNHLKNQGMYVVSISNNKTS
jgi:hypothetical protein